MFVLARAARLNQFGRSSKPDRWFKSIIAFLFMGVICFHGQSCKQDPIQLKQMGRPAAFVLADQDGNPFHYEPASGRIRLVIFGYTSCPDFCPATLSKIEKALLAMPEPPSERPQVIFVTIDPERDTPQKLKAYLSKYSVSITGLSGPKAVLDSVTRSFDAYYRIEEKDGKKNIDHTTYIFLIDREGDIRYHFTTVDKPDRLAEGLRILYSQKTGAP
jgi:protein SCO1/2